MSEFRLTAANQQDYLKWMIRTHHYTHSVPSGKSVLFDIGQVIVMFSIPANNNIGQFVFGEPGHTVWELSRMWAPDGHESFALTRAIAEAIREFRLVQPDVEALVSYADPNAGHLGGVYRAASWIYTGQCEDMRVWVSPDGQVHPRRKFHSGHSFLRKPDIEKLGYTEAHLPGKHRFLKGLTWTARRMIRKRVMREAKCNK